MDGFLLARPDGVLRTRGARARYSTVEHAVAALRSGTTDLVVGALPFDPSRPTALLAPLESHTAADLAMPLTGLPGLTLVTELPAPAEHVERVTRLIKLIREGTLGKVVAARSVVLAAETPVDPELLVAHLVGLHPTANGFAVDLGNSTLVGASPELLVQRRGRTVSLSPLAGTLPRRSDPAADLAQRQALLDSAKDHAEHAYVVEWIRQQLSPICTELTIPDEPIIISTPEVWHLATPIVGTLNDSAPSALEIAALLHPTPAVCGTPTDLALTTIAETEEDRGFYGGAVGWCDASGDGEWIVAIRCAELDADRTTLRAFAGGGIVATSDAQSELDETTAKLRTVLRPFGMSL
ncbi:isochorismate synthase MenF [Antrihabitans sp. YC2-6]|uniref:isochorismate synthase n=1 Tax=Antrihabitans sp. YC2-6 TaxID=2799498 RepID=UPI0018F39431|nr:isochorismate synthase [Antrihabitans sp. YC2-6]MBJ8347725.1 isochorismate synthase [Antrihabitans sp. YC2-6]